MLIEESFGPITVYIEANANSQKLVQQQLEKTIKFHRNGCIHLTCEVISRREHSYVDVGRRARFIPPQRVGKIQVACMT